MLTATPYIVEMFRNICADVQTQTNIQINYVHGTRKNIDDALLAFEKTGYSAYKWPMIGLIQPFTEKASSVRGTLSDVEFKIVIATRTDPSYSPDIRETQSFVPVLRPIYRQLIKSILSSGYFTGGPNQKLSLSHTDLYEWGEQGTSVFSDYVDAILIENLQLSIKDFNCS